MTGGFAGKDGLVLMPKKLVELMQASSGLSLLVDTGFSDGTVINFDGDGGNFDGDGGNFDGDGVDDFDGEEVFDDSTPTMPVLFTLLSLMILVDELSFFFLFLGLKLSHNLDPAVR